jgi:hypothetical protein
LEQSVVTTSLPNSPVAPLIATLLGVAVDDDNPSDMLITMENTKTFVDLILVCSHSGQATATTRDRHNALQIRKKPSTQVL